MQGFISGFPLFEVHMQFYFDEKGYPPVKAEECHAGELQNVLIKPFHSSRP